MKRPEHSDTKRFDRQKKGLRDVARWDYEKGASGSEFSPAKEQMNRAEGRVREDGGVGQARR